MKKIIISFIIIFTIISIFTISYASWHAGIPDTQTAMAGSSQSNVGTGTLRVQYYYGVKNDSSSAKSVTIWLCGPSSEFYTEGSMTNSGWQRKEPYTNHAWKSKYLLISDSIPANRIRLYLLDTYTAANGSSYERSALGFYDYTLNSDGTVGDYVTGGSIAHTSMPSTYQGYNVTMAGQKIMQKKYNNGTSGTWDEITDHKWEDVRVKSKTVARNVYR